MVKVEDSRRQVVGSYPDHVLCSNPENGRVDIEDFEAFKIQLHGLELNESSENNVPQKVLSCN